MPFPKLNILALLIVLFAAGFTYAEEEKAEGEKAAPVDKVQQEFSQKSAHMTALATHIEDSEKQFNELVARKTEAKSSAEKQAIIVEMNTVTADRNKAAEEYNKLKSELSLRFPNQGEHLERRYQTQEKKSVEQLEGAAGLDELLTRIKKVIEKKFAAFDAEEKPKPVKVKPANAPEEEKPLRLEK